MYYVGLKIEWWYVLVIKIAPEIDIFFHHIKLFDPFFPKNKGMKRNIFVIHFLHLHTFHSMIFSIILKVTFSRYEHGNWDLIRYPTFETDFNKIAMQTLHRYFPLNLFYPFIAITK